MPDITCAPSCDPKVPTTLSAISGGGVVGAGPTLGASCTSPMFVEICKSNDYERVILCNPVNGKPVFVTTAWNELGVPTTTATNLDGTAYAGAISGLTQCPGAALESDQVVMCDGTTTFIRWIVKSDGAPNGTKFDTNLLGAPYTASAAATIGACVIASLVNAGVATIAGGARAATAAFAGALPSFTTATVPSKLQSITIAAKGVMDGLPNLTGNQVQITAPNGTVINMFDGETRSFSVVRDQDDSLKREYVIAATGNAYANISYTFV